MGFKDPIVAGSTLVRDAIQSAGFVAGSSGWQIKRDGTSELNSTTIRGSLIVQAPNQAANKVQVVGSVASTSTKIEFDVLNGVPAYLYTDFTGGATTRFFVDLNGQPLFQGDNASASGRAIMRCANNFFEMDGTAGRIATTLPIAATDNGVDETWHNIVLQNSWVTDAATPQYRMKPDGWVYLRGNMKNGTTVAGTIFGSLPATGGMQNGGYRPANTMRFIAAEQQLGTGFRHIQVQAGGNLTIFNATAAFACLDGIHFPGPLVT